MGWSGSGQNSRTAQLWLSFGQGVAGKQPWETPVGYVHESDGLSVVKSINTELRSDFKLFSFLYYI